MSAWVLIPCLVALREEFNRVSPNRDKGADGSIGDSAHTSSSDHTPDEDSDVLRDHDADSKNEVHALDIDSSGPWPAAGWFDAAIKALVARHRSGADDRLQYVIWNRQIASRSFGWTWRTYTGTADPHTNHAHFSARYTTAQETDTSPWGVVTGEDETMLVKKGDSGEEVRYWQFLLAELGYSPGETDGQYGPKMEAAVNAYRAAVGYGPLTYISGWQAFHMQRALATKYAGKPGTPGKDGAPGVGGTFSGTLTITGGQLAVEAS